MPIIANTTSANTFSAVRAQLNSVTKRINAFAGNESTLYANTINANVSLKISGTDVRATFAQNTYVKTTLANTNSYIAAQAARITLVNTNLTGTNTALRTLINARLQVSNAATIYQTKAVERAALANTNSSIATQTSRITLVNTNLTATNTAIRTLVSDRLQVANASAIYATKSNPTTSGLLAHTGRTTISTNLTVSGNTTIGAAGKIANATGWFGVAGRATVSTNLFVAGNTAITGLVNIRYTGSANSTLNISGTNTRGGAGYHDFLVVRNGGGGTNPNKYFRLNSTGSLEIINDAYTANLFTLNNSGDLTASGNVTAYSDENLKENVSTIENALALIEQMRGVRYNRIEDGKAGVGVIAQEMQKILPEVVHEGDHLSVAYGNLVGVLIEAVKELSARVKELEAK